MDTLPADWHRIHGTIPVEFLCALLLCFTQQNYSTYFLTVVLNRTEMDCSLRFPEMSTLPVEKEISVDTQSGEAVDLDGVELLASNSSNALLRRGLLGGQRLDRSQRRRCLLSSCSGSFLVALNLLQQSDCGGLARRNLISTRVD